MKIPVLLVVPLTIAITFVARAGTITWVGGSGDWNSLANWSTGALPGPDDDVVIDKPGDIVVTNSSGANTAKSLRSQDSFVLSGGSLTVSGTVQVNNTFILSGGTLVHASVLKGANGEAITATGGTLDGVTLGSDVSLDDSQGLTIVNGLTLSGATVTLNSLGNSAYLYINAGTQMIGGNGEIVLAGNSAYLYLTGFETTLTLGPNVTVHGRGKIIQANGATSTLINQGTIQADSPGGTLTITANALQNIGTLGATNGGPLEGATFEISSTTWSNTGTITAYNSTLTFDGTGPWSNSGTITAANSTVNLGGQFQQADLGTFIRTGGTVNLTGTLSGGLLLDAATGSWTINGGTIKSGTVVASGGPQLVVKNCTLDGVTLATDVSINDNSQVLSIANGLTFSGGATITLNSSANSIYLYINAGTQMIGGNGEIVLAGNSAYLYLTGFETTLTLGPNVTVHGGGSIIQANGASSTLINQGTISADSSGGTFALNVNSFTNHGNITVASGASLSVNSSLSFDDAKFLAMQIAGTLQLSGSLLGSTRAGDFYSPLGTTVLNGKATSGSPQLFEVMGRELGSKASGFDHNFAYGTLALANTTYVRLVDQSRNSVGAAPEAFYVNSLVVPSGCTLDLGGFHLYARATQIAGSIIGGLISQVADSGPIFLGTPTSGTISMPGELDEWTFFGRSQQSVTIVLDTGSGNVLTPWINYAEVQLLDPSTNVLTRASNSVPAQVVTLTNVILPADGIYRVRVSAPGNQSASTGNYLMTVWNVAANVVSLVLNQKVNGLIESPYSVDDWNFSAVANQQVQFHLLNVSAPGVAFDLKGPNGSTVFSNLLSDSDLLTLRYSGAYTLTAHSIGSAYNVAYAFQLAQTAQTNLVPGATLTGYFAGNGEAQLFAISVTNGGPLQLVLNNAGLNNVELYAKRGSPPTRSDFDFRSVTPNASNQQILIPYAVIGTYYVLVYGDLISTPGNYTINATSSAVILTGILPDRDANNVAVNMTITGAGFRAGTAADLIASNGTTYPAASVSVDSFTQITSTFPPNLAPPGIYSLRVHQPEGDTATLVNIFEMLTPSAAKLETRLYMPASLGRHVPATIYLEYANTGNVAMPAPLLLLHTTDTNGTVRPVLTLDPTRIAQDFWSAGLPPGTANEVFLLASGAQPGLLNPGERIQVPVYYLGLQQPWPAASQVPMEIRYWTADDPTPIDWASRKDALRPPTLDSDTWNVVFNNLTSDLTNTAAYIQMLSDNAQYLSRLGQRVLDVDNLWNFEVQQAYGYSAIPVLDSAVDASMTSPGVTLNFPRRFSSSLRVRYSKGWFGVGWYTPWQATLQVQNGGGLVMLVSEGGSARVFTQDTRSGGYFSGAGDSSQLSALGGGVYEVRDPNGVVTRFRADGKIEYVQDPNGNRVTASYNGLGQLSTLSHTSGASIVLTWNGDGLLQSCADSAGRSATYVYDPSNTYLMTVTTDDRKVTSYTYQTNGTPAQLNALTSVSRRGATRSFTFDTRGRLQTTFLASAEQLVTLGYDSAGGVSVTDTQGTTFLYFDYHGLLPKVTDPLGNNTTAEFNSDLRLSRMVTPTGETRSFTWCDCGSLTSLTDELGHTTSFQHNNPFKRLTSLTDAWGNITAYTYDGSGNLLATIYPNGSVEQLGNYTASGFAQSYTNRRSQPITYTYTVAGQVQRQSLPDGTFANYFYDARGNLLQIAQVLTDSTTNVTVYSYNYSTDGDHLRQVTYPNGRWVAFSYDAYGRRQQISDSTGQTNNYEYDSAGRLWKVRDASTNVFAEYIYDAAGLLKTINKGNGTSTTYDYDAAGQLLHLTNAAPNGSINSRFNYTYDNRGRRRTMQTVDGNWVYDYDGSGQLTHAVFTSANIAINDQDLLYIYDDAGNRNYTVLNGAMVDYVANNMNEYASVGGTNYQYDADGNLTFDGILDYSYDVQSRLIGMSGPGVAIQYQYDALGNRTGTMLNGQRSEYLLDPSGLVNTMAELDGSGAVTARYVQGRGLVAMARGTGEHYFYDYDAVGATSALTDNSGSQVDRYVYHPFGEELFAKATVSNQHEFVGQFGVTLEHSGLYFMRARFFNPGLGSFTSTDPIGLDGTDPNLYRYARNTPLLYVDPTGLASACDVRGLVVCGAIGFAPFSQPLGGLVGLACAVATMSFCSPPSNGPDPWASVPDLPPPPRGAVFPRGGYY